MKATQRQPKGLHGTTVADNEQSSAIRREDPSQGKVPSWLQPCSEVAYFREITIPPSNGNREHFEAYQGFFVGRTARTGNLGISAASMIFLSRSICYGPNRESIWQSHYSENHSAPSAFRSGALESIIKPVNGRLSSIMRKIAQAAEKANSERHVKSVVFSGEKRL